MLPQQDELCKKNEVLMHNFFAPIIINISNFSKFSHFSNFYARFIRIKTNLCIYYTLPPSLRRPAPLKAKKHPALPSWEKWGAYILYIIWLCVYKRNSLCGCFLNFFGSALHHPAAAASKDFIVCKIL